MSYSASVSSREEIASGIPSRLFGSTKPSGGWLRSPLEEIPRDLKLYFKNWLHSTFSGFSDKRLSPTTIPATEKSLSTDVEAGGAERYLRTTGPIRLNLEWLLAQKSVSGSELRGKHFSFIYSVTCFLTGSMESSDASSSESSVSIRTASHGSTVSVAVAGACSSILVSLEICTCWFVTISWIRSCYPSWFLRTKPCGFIARIHQSCYGILFPGILFPALYLVLIIKIFLHLQFKERFECTNPRYNNTFNLKVQFLHKGYHIRDGAILRFCLFCTSECGFQDTAITQII